jgi:hypothetical protein
MTKRERRTLDNAISSAKEVKVSKLPPALAYSYQSALSEICGVHNRSFKQADFDKILERQRMLDDLGVAYDSFAYTVVKSWYTWCKTQGIHGVPLNIFLGENAWERFLKMRDSTVKLDTPGEGQRNLAIHNELTAAKLYIDARLNRRFAMTLGIARSMMQAGEPEPDIVEEVETLLSMVYGCSGDYDTIAKTLIRKRRERRATMPRAEKADDASTK